MFGKSVCIVPRVWMPNQLCRGFGKDYHSRHIHILFLQLFSEFFRYEMIVPLSATYAKLGMRIQYGSDDGCVVVLLIGCGNSTAFK